MNKSQALQLLIDDHLRRKTQLLDARDVFRNEGKYQQAEIAQIRSREVTKSLKSIMQVKTTR